MRYQPLESKPTLALNELPLFGTGEFEQTEIQQTEKFYARSKH